MFYTWTTRKPPRSTTNAQKPDTLMLGTVQRDLFLKNPFKRLDGTGQVIVRELSHMQRHSGGVTQLPCRHVRRHALNRLHLLLT